MCCCSLERRAPQKRWKYIQFMKSAGNILCIRVELRTCNYFGLHGTSGAHQQRTISTVDYLRSDCGEGTSAHEVSTTEGEKQHVRRGSVDDQGSETTSNTSAQAVSTTKGEKQQATRPHRRCRRPRRRGCPKGGRRGGGPEGGGQTQKKSGPKG